MHSSTGKLLRTMQANEGVAQKVAQANIPSKEFITVPAADGTTQLNGWIIKPQSFDNSKKYPVVMVRHRGSWGGFLKTDLL